ncbi:DEAD/DEAH box helicase [Clostridium butyricum]|uniref:DEAD/DEAH box helicase n=1 Tax=Clostridium butyricum TaxID=1492 RepID=A0A512TPD3_CLOBU|nr:DEAD/DEAH box helicase [Clostridium butyricum]NOW24890.1 SNF2 family DNA or RNA helicase [Clostridium butyricum]GEQ22105.1 DEAD/DEAH box helicase [Clostridium butyricum]
MIFKPHNYQEYAKEWIIEKPSSGLFLDLGMGKTVCTLTAVEELLYDYFDVAKVLVIAPLRVAEDTWSSEVEKWEHLKNLKISKVLGKEEVRITALKEKADIYVINRENVEWLVEYLGKGWFFDMVVIDELSSFKSPKSNRFKALKKVRPFIKKIVGLTGTPAPNGLLDLWSQVYILDGGERLGKTLTGYRDRYFQPDKRNQTVIFSWKPVEGAEDRIYQKLKDICISMKASDYLELPERINNSIMVQLPKIAEEKYKKLEKELLLPLEEADVVANTAAVLTNKLLQMANGAVYDENGEVKEIHDAKLKALDDVIEAANGKSVLVFYSYKHDLDKLSKHLKNKDFRVLNTSKDIEAWNKGEVPIMLVHPASAGHGLNLQFGGNIIVWFGLTWSLELYQQANARLYRQGQQQSVVVNHIIAKGTIDEDVMRALENKEVGQEALLQAVKARLKQISAS